jgi:aromatase
MAAHTDNEVVIDAPRDFVWERMMDIEGWPKLFTEYAEAEVLEQEGDTVRFRLSTHPDPEHDNTVWSWVSERVADPDNWQSKSKRIETGPFEFMDIEWYFEEAGDGTKMRWVQDFSMKPDAPADDPTAEAHMNKTTKEQMGIIKERLEQEAAER